MSASSAAQLETANPRTWEELEASPQWARLSSHQKAWVVALIANGGDPVDATRFAYKCASIKNEICLSHEVRNHPAVIDALAFWNGAVVDEPAAKSQRDRTRDALAAAVRKAIRKAEPGSTSHQKLLAQLERLVLGGNSGRPDTAEPPVIDGGTFETKHHVGELFSQNGQNFRATEIGSDGRILNAEEVD